MIIVSAKKPMSSYSVTRTNPLTIFSFLVELY